MVQVSVSATVSVADGPILPVGSELKPDSYVVADAELDPVGGPNVTVEVSLLPLTGTVSLLAVSARASDGTPATVTLTPSNDGTDGADLTVEGSLLIANASALAGLVAGGPRTLTLTNTEATATSVDIVACLDS